ncbi:hypothetical protein K3495_g5326 [Podosphaera aphanis]|nr:hypothetical protein K3495_g5326 [Podosphaera aphanis]
MESVKNQSSPKKRSLFSKQILAKVSVAKDPVDFFSRAKEVYPKLLQEEEQKRQNRLKDLENKRSSREIESTEISSLEGKRRRLDTPESIAPEPIALENPAPITQSEDIKWIQRESFKATSPIRKTRSPSLQNNHTLSKSQELHRETYLSIDKKESSTYPTKGLARSAPIRPILLDDDSEDDKDPPLPPPKSSIVEHVTESSDEEYPELIQQARERERLKALRLNAVKSSREQILRAPNNTLDDVFETRAEPVIELDPTVELLITSEIEGTKPLRVKRKLSQRLKEARLIWCDRQPIKRDALGRTLQDVIFFTWRRKRLFDATTCGSLGLKLNKEGKLLPIEDGADSSGNIHLEAWTEEAFKISELRAAAAAEDKEQDQNDEESTHNNSSSNSKFKVIMKARGMDSCKLVVRPTTTIAKMADAFRKAKAIPESTTISLRFDGDVLDPNSTVQDTELGDMENIDTVEVYLKSN